MEYNDTTHHDQTAFSYMGVVGKAVLYMFLSKNTWKVGGGLQNKTVLQLNTIDRGELLFMHFFDTTTSQ